jgi:hypothetical protein
MMTDVSMQYASYTENTETECVRDDWHKARNYWLKRSFDLGLLQARVAHNRYQYYCRLLAEGDKEESYDRPY